MAIRRNIAEIYNGSMAQTNTESKQNGRLFKNALIERLTKTHIAVPLIIFYGASLAIVLYTIQNMLVSGPSIALMYVLGFFFFTFIEYVVHRYVFHMAPTTEWRKKMAYNFHGVHHDFPKDKQRLAMPPVVSVVLALGLILSYRVVLGLPGFPFGAGFIAGYASYLVVHYSTHAFKPPKNFLKVLWVHHNVHHYQNQKVAFGVSSPFWDVVFGTMPPKK